MWYNEEEPPTTKTKKGCLMDNSITVGEELRKYFLKVA